MNYRDFRDIAFLKHANMRWTSHLSMSGVLLLLCLLPQAVLGSTLNLTGLTEAVQDSNLGLSTNGRVVAISVKDGDRVNKGDLLLKLDQDLEILEVERRKLIWKSKVEINSVQQQVKTLQKHLRSTRELFEKTGSVPREELENKELELAFAIADFNRLKIAEQREKIEYQTALRQLEKRNLYAPFDGQVAQVLIGIGENCEIDTPLIRLVDSSSLYFVANVEPDIAEQMSDQQSVTIVIEHQQGRIETEGTLVFINPQIDPASGLRTLKAMTPNPAAEIIPGISGVMVLEVTEPAANTVSGQ